MVDLDKLGITTVQDALRVARLDWTVAKVPLTPLMSASVPNLDDYRMIVRMTDNHCYGFVSPKYEVVQNSDLFGWFDFLLHEGDVTLARAGSWDHGSRIFLQAKIRDDLRDVAPGDSVAAYITALSGHGGASSITLSFTSMRLICMNQLGGLVPAVSIPHRRGANDCLVAAKSRIDLARRRFVDDVDDYKAMAERRLSTSEAMAILEELFPRTPTGRAPMALRRSFENIYSGPGQSGRCLTAWSVYNGVTYWLDHQRGKTIEAQTKNALTTGYAVRHRARELCLG